MVFLVIEERKAIEPDHSVRNARFAKAVANSFGYADNYLSSASVLCLWVEGEKDEPLWEEYRSELR
jgi:hypothetical protein